MMTATRRDWRDRAQESVQVEDGKDMYLMLPDGTEIKMTSKVVDGKAELTLASQNTTMLIRPVSVIGVSILVERRV